MTYLRARKCINGARDREPKIVEIATAPTWSPGTVGDGAHARITRGGRGEASYCCRLFATNVMYISTRMVLWVSDLGTGNSCNGGEKARNNKNIAGSNQPNQTNQPTNQSTNRPSQEQRAPDAGKAGARNNPSTKQRRKVLICSNPIAYLQPPLLPHEGGESAHPSERHGAELDVEVVVEMSLERL